MKQLTKRQLKALNGPNAMVERSRRLGKNQVVGETLYRGSYSLPWVHA